MEYRIPEIKLRIVRESIDIKLSTPTSATEAICHLCGGNPTVESFCILYVDGRNRLISGRIIGMGGISSCSITAREVFQGACDAGANGIILGHNHPSGNPVPSHEDRILTEKLIKAGEVLGIPIVDHIIVTEHNGSLSFLESNLL